MVRADCELAPYLPLIDRTMLGLDDIEAVAEIKRRYADGFVLMIMPDNTEHFILARLQAGANGCIRNYATREELRVAIRNVLQGKSYLRMDASGKVVNAYLGGRPFSAGSALDKLTPRERDVLKLVAAGKSSKNITQCPSLSVKTIGKHRANLMVKLGVHNAAGLTAYAIVRGLLFWQCYGP